MQPQIAVVLGISEGTSTVTESIFENRFKYVGELARMGANFKVESNIAIIGGIENYTGARVNAPDLRAGAALVIAGLAAEGITVVDDYGHHHTEIKATLAAASSLGYKHVDVVFQPHRYSRLQALCDDFADAFANADKLLLIDVFSAGEMPIPGVTSKMLADTVRAKHPGKEVVYCSSRLELNEELEKMVGEGDLLLTMGAGDVTTGGPEFIEYLTAKKAA